MIHSQFNLNISVKDVYNDKMNELKLLFNDFSTAANKCTGSANQFDRNRWLKYLIACHANSASRKSKRDALSEWLKADGWSEDIASDLRCEFDFAMDLLSFQNCGS